MKPEFREVKPWTGRNATIYRSFDCSHCGLKIYQITEKCFKRNNGKYLHELCVSAVKAK